MTSIRTKEFNPRASEAINNPIIQKSLGRLANFRQGRDDAIAEFGCAGINTGDGVIAVAEGTRVARRH